MRLKKEVQERKMQAVFNHLQQQIFVSKTKIEDYEIEGPEIIPGM